MILCKLEYRREGGSAKHLQDIRAILRNSAVELDATFLDREIARRGLRADGTPQMQASPVSYFGAGNQKPTEMRKIGRWPSRRRNRNATQGEGDSGDSGARKLDGTRLGIYS